MKVTRQGMDARNLSRLNPILGLNRVPAELTGWTKLITLDDLGTVELTCDGGKNVVPHGIDADVMFGLTTAFELQGQPQDATVQLNVQELCEYAGLPAGGNSYQVVRESLQRLKDVSLTAKSCWAHQVAGTQKWRWRSVCFNVVESISIADEIEGPARPYLFSATTTVRIRLNPDLAQSLREGHTRKLDLQFYARLAQPLARLLYRTLEELRETTAGGSVSLTFPLLSWGEHLGFRELDPTQPESKIPATRVLRPDKVRRALEPAHRDLHQRGYLREVTYVGRGKAQSLTYTFAVAEVVSQPVDMKLVGLLTTRGVTLGRAQELARSYDSEEIQAAAAKFDARLAAGYRPRSRGAVMADMLTNAGKYAEASPVPAPVETLNTSPRSQEAQEGPDEGAAPPRAQASAETLLLGALRATVQGREVRARLVEAYVAGHGSTLDLVRLSRLPDGEAQQAALDLLASWNA